ncbi:MAG: hypothetical protein NXI31_02590 [bacterium]|nr:hypothetical protein [bacterium]
MPDILSRRALLATLAAVATALPGQDGKQLFQSFCGACHLPDRVHVGPSAIEIAGLYRGKRAEFLAWCKAPSPKRKGVIQMPPMGYLGDAKLTAIHRHILASTVGQKEVVVKNADRFRASPSMRRRPLVMRIFMPDAGPAAIAVAVNDDYHYCFDAGACRLRYVWQGDFIDGWPVWRANGNALAKIVGDIVLREPRSPLPVQQSDKRKFLGYRLRAGLPTFRYRLGEVRVEERITPLPGGRGLARRFRLEGAPRDWRLRLTAPVGMTWRSGDGEFDGLEFTPAVSKRAEFTLTLEQK